MASGPGAGALALPETRLKVNACGHLTDISPEGQASVSTLLWELVAKLKVCNPSSLQLADLSGQPIKTDGDLNNAVREGRTPLQAKLTVAALHEIEQKKKESRNKEHDLVSLQWQIVIEQVASFQYDLTTVAGQMQSIKDDCSKMVNAFANEEELRRSALLNAVKDEVIEREAGQREFVQKFEALAQLVQAERSAREVADYQLAKQIEDLGSEVHTERNGRNKDEAEYSRLLSAMRHDLDMEVQRSADHGNRTVGTLKRIETAEGDHVSASQVTQQRLTLLEAESEKLRAALSVMDSNVQKQISDTHKHLQRSGEEIERNISQRKVGEATAVIQVGKESEIIMLALEERVQRANNEVQKNHFDIIERSRVLELRCAALEKDHADNREAQTSAEYGLLDKMHTTVTAVDSLHMDKQATEVQLRQMGTRVEDLLKRMGQAEGGIDTRVSDEQWRAQLENVIGVIQKLDTKVAQMDRDMRARFSQEAIHREGMKTQLHGSIRNCLDKITVNDGEDNIKPLSAIQTMARPEDRSRQAHSPMPSMRTPGSGTMMVVRPGQQIDGRIIQRNPSASTISMHPPATEVHSLAGAYQWGTSTPQSPYPQIAAVQSMQSVQNIQMNGAA